MYKVGLSFVINGNTLSFITWNVYPTLNLKELLNTITVKPPISKHPWGPPKKVFKEVSAYGRLKSSVCI